MKRIYLSPRSLMPIAFVLLSTTATSEIGAGVRSSGTTAEVEMRGGKPFERAARLELRPGIVIKRELLGRDSHSYTVTLCAGEYMHLGVQQKGIDVLVTVFGPGDEKLIEVDSPNGRYGPEPVSLICFST